jgi:hypothetical protein
VPTLDLAIDAGGEGPPPLATEEPRGGNMVAFIMPFELLEMGGEASCPRLVGLGE